MPTQSNELEPLEPGLPIDEHLPFHRTGWIVQAIGFTFIFSMIVSASLGLFGDGIISKVTESNASASIEYERFYRFEARMPLIVTFVNSGNQSGTVSFENHYLQNFKIESILPEPSGNTVRDGRVHYTFDGLGPTQVVFHLIPQKIGKLEGNITVRDTNFPIHHLIYP